MTETEQQVRQVLARVTLYPAELLAREADLEDDLGLDAGRRADALTALREHFSLPAAAFPAHDAPRTIAGLAERIDRGLAGGAAPWEPDAAGTATPAAGGVDAPSAAAPLPVAAPPEGARSAPAGTAAPAPANAMDELERRVLGRLAAALQASLGAEPAAAPPTPPDPARPPEPRLELRPGAPARTRAEVEATVIEVIERLTRYPREILVPSAELEEELGIDSVKRGEILAVLLTEFGTPPGDPPVPAAPPRTIADVVELIAAAPAPAAPFAAAPPAAPAPPPHANGAAPALRIAAFAAPAGEARPFEGKVALVTGSGHGLGRSIATRLAALGARVVVNSFYSRERGEETTGMIRDAGGDAVHLWGSVANTEHLGRIFAEIETRYGCLDFFVHNASNGIIAPLDTVTEEHWDRAFRTNVVALHQGAYLAAPLMRRRGGGRIVTLSSPGAQRYLEYFGCLGPVKAALESLTMYLAVDLGPDNIQVNAVSAGPVYGERLSAYPDAGRLIPYWEGLSADRRLGDADDITGPVLYLLSDAARKINGTVLLVDGAASQRM